MMGKYVQYLAVFSSGERFPVLLYSETYQPVILTTRYIIQRRREFKQAGTIARDLRVLHWFYEWCDDCDIDIETRLREGRLLSTEEITGFCRYLRARRNNHVIGSVVRAETDRLNILSSQTFNNYTGVIKDFLLWAADQFIPEIAPADQLRERIDEATRRIQQAFRSNGQAGRRYSQRIPLTHEEIAALRAVIKPGSGQNPFKKPLQFRNYLIIELMLATGVRRGELLKIKIRHLPVGPKHTLTIARSPDDKEDPRRREPQVKTLGREIPIPARLNIDLWAYAQNQRRAVRHPYLFTSHRGGVPLDAAGVNHIFDLLVQRCFPYLKGRLHPHVMRHTFNVRLLEQANSSSLDEELKRGVQCYLNGWSEQSRMPALYTRKHIEAEAMKVAEQFQSLLYAE